MIRVTIWYENVQERGIADPRFMPEGIPEDQIASFSGFLEKSAEEIRAAYPHGVGETLKECLNEQEDISAELVTLDMPHRGLTDELLERTDVLIWWAHIAHDAVPDELAAKIQQRVLRGMGFIALHSAHLCKPLRFLLGTSCTLQWREGDFERLFITAPTHPIAHGIPASFELETEEMYGEYFDIPKPDDVIFTGWFRGGEVFRSGCTWSRGYGKVFYFQPGHETNPTYHNPWVRKILVNAVHWAAPCAPLRDTLDCTHAAKAPEEKSGK